MAGVVARPSTITTTTSHPPVISRYNNSKLDVNVVFLIISNLIITGILNTISATINPQHLTVCAIIIGTTITLRNISTRITRKINHRLPLPVRQTGTTSMKRIHRRCGPVVVNTMTTIIPTPPHRPPRGRPFLQPQDLQVNPRNLDNQTCS